MRSLIKTVALATFGAISLSSSAAVLAQEAQYTPPEDEMAEARAIVEVVLPPETAEQMMLQTMSTVIDQMSGNMMNDPVFEEPGIRAIMDEFIADLPEVMRPMVADYIPVLKNATAIAYTRQFTLEELKDIRAFASTSSGAKYFATSPSLLSDPAVEKANKGFFEATSSIQAEQAQLVAQKVTAYLLANPEVLERLKARGTGSE